MAKRNRNNGKDRVVGQVELDQFRAMGCHCLYPLDWRYGSRYRERLEEARKTLAAVDSVKEDRFMNRHRKVRR